MWEGVGYLLLYLSKGVLLEIYTYFYIYYYEDLYFYKFKVFIFSWFFSRIFDVRFLDLEYFGLC